MLEPTDGLSITEDTTFKPGVYALPKGISIDRDGVRLEGNGAVLVGDQRQGQGVTIEGREKVSIKNLSIRDYYHGIKASHCKDLKIEGCRITSTAEVDANTIFLDIWLPAEKAYGGGIYLHEVEEAEIRENDLQHQQNGLLSYQCRRLRVIRNLANYCSGFGFHLFETSESIFEDNYADYCCRYQPRGEGHGHLGADAAGFLIVYKSSNNVLRNNYARMGGDGFFLAGLTPQLQLVSCDDNLFEGNDASYSPNNGFEGVFSGGNIFRDNIANYCNYGFWLGFARENTLEGNQMAGNRQAGLAVENGFGFVVYENTFTANAHGVLLWSKFAPEIHKPLPENLTSYDWQIEKNLFRHNNKAIRIAANQDHGIRPYPAPDQQMPLTPKPNAHVIRGNQFANNRRDLDLERVEGTVVEGNEGIEIRDM